MCSPGSPASRNEEAGVVMRTGRLATAGLALAATTALLPLTGWSETEVFLVDNSVYRAECASCHIAYPPQLLSKESWRALMGDLANHFGTDASVDAKTAQEIQRYLEANAGGARAGEVKPPLRITETHWFRHEHDEVPAAVWKVPAVKSAANCGACHTQAERGDFSERSLRVPR
jgi:nitrate/TMAO reductase-like tetraheme cytochrome c subunit